MLDMLLLAVHRTLLVWVHTIGMYLCLIRTYFTFVYVRLALYCRVTHTFELVTLELLNFVVVSGQLSTYVCS